MNQDRIIENERQAQAAIKQRVEQLELLRRTTLAITSELDQSTLLHRIIKQAVNLLSARSGGIKIYHPERNCLEVVADYGHPQSLVGHCMKVGEGMAGQLVLSDQPFIIINNYSEWPDRLESVARRGQLASTIAVKLVWQERVIGVLYLDDTVNRDFTEQDANLLGLFADHAAIAYINAELVARDVSKSDRLEHLSQAINEIMRGLGRRSLNEQLELIVSRAAQILEAEACGIWRIDQEGSLTLAADFGYKTRLIQTLPVRSKAGGGLTSHIAHSGRLFNAYGQALANHFAVNKRKSQTFSGKCFSLLATPIKQQTADQEKMVGLLRIENKKDVHGQIGPHLSFTAEDETILQIFAETVSVALESTSLVTQLKAREEHVSQLIASSPVGVVANNPQGEVTYYNDQAQAILGYDKEEVMGGPVGRFYTSPFEAANIGRMLRQAADNKVAHHDTLVNHRNGRFLPIRLSATLLKDAQGNPMGTVGYFEDLRLVRETEKRLQLIHEASKLVAEADRVTEGLQAWAKMMVAFWDVSFCRIFLLDDDGQTLTMEAAYPLADQVDDWQWQPGIGEVTAVSDWPGLQTLLEKYNSNILRPEHPDQGPVLKKWREMLQLSQDIHSLLVIPLRIRDKIIGLLDLGQLQPVPFSKDQEKLAITIAQQTAVLIDHARLFEKAKLAETQLRISYEASNQLISEQDPEEVWREMVESICEAAESDGIRLLAPHPVLGQIDLVTSGCSDMNVNSMTRANGLTAQVMQSGRPQIVEDSDKEKERVNPSYFQRGIRAALGLPVAIKGQTIAVLWIYYKAARRFPQSQIEALQFYVNQAAIAYDNAHRIKVLEQVRQSAADLAAATSLREVLEQAIVHARQLFQANSAAIWFFDDARDKFILPYSVVTGISSEFWADLQAAEPHANGGAQKAMAQGWIGITDVANWTDDTFLSEATRQRLLAIGVRSYQAIALQVGEEKLGVLYVNYNNHRTFGEQERKTALTFAHHVALSLKKAELVKQLRKVQEAVGVVAAVTTLAGLDETLRSVVEGMKDVLDCDAVTLHMYDQSRQRIKYPPTMAGVRYPDEVSPTWIKIEDSLVVHILDSNRKIYEADDVKTDPLFSNSRFAKREEIASCACVALRMHNENVGVMFINYRTPYRFVSEELATIELFADQAAVAIHNAQLYEREKEQAVALLALDAMERVAAGSHNLVEEILFDIVRQASELTGKYGEAARHSHIALVEDGKLVFKAMHPREKLHQLQKDVGPIDLSAGQAIGVMGQAVMQGKPVLEPDVARNASYILYHPETKSELAVPIRYGEAIIGAINVERPVQGAFDKQDIQALMSLADYAAIAIQNGQLYQREQRQTAELMVLNEAAQAITRSLKLSEILTLIAAQAWQLASRHRRRILYSSIWLVTGKTQVQVVATCPPEHLVQTQAVVGQDMDWTVGKNGRIGIVGRMMQTGQFVLVHDVTKDQDYLPSHHETRSELAVPMKLGREIVGIINVEDSDYHAFDEGTISALSSLAAQAAIAIQNAQLYERMQKRTVALAALHEASRAITQSLNVDQVLATIVEQAFMLASVGETKAHLAAVSLAKDGKLNFVATYPPERLPALQMIVNDVDLEQEEGIGFTGRVAKLGRPLRLPDVAQSKDYILFDPTIHSSLAVPINVGQEVRGVITIEHQQFGAFNEEDEQVLTALAMQAALALQNAQEFQETKVLQKVSASLAGVLEVEDILQLVMKAALELTDTTSGSIIFWDEKQKRYYPSYTTQGESLISYQTSARPQAGYTWQILQENRSIVIADTLTDPKVNPTQFPKGRLCHVGVPLPSTVAPPAVLWVHGLRSQQFSEHQVTVLETLANAASVALEKAWQYEELKKAKGLVGARTALAWMGMASSAWRHSIEGHATNIKAAVTLLRPQIQQAVKDPKAAANIQAKLDIIYAQAVQVHERRITVPLGTEESTQRVVMNDLIHERLLQLWQDEPYSKIEGPFLEMATTTNLAVWASPEWLRLALDLLVDNAVDAMQKSAVRRLTVMTQQIEDTIEIAIRDTGPGIDPELLPQLFTERAEQPQREGHLGRGLLMVQAIVQTYHGDIDVGETGPNGTTMVLSLPLSPEA